MDEEILVSVCMPCHNRVDLIGKTFKSILNQTYEPLEIVISDNASTDGTSEFIQSMIRDYRKNGGKHRIVYHRNEIGIRGEDNITQSYRMASGELLVSAHDDDVSYPNRVQCIVDFCRSKSTMPMALMNDAYKVDVKGRRIGVVEGRDWDIPLAAVATYHRKVFEVFTEGVPEGCMGDIIFPRVAGMIGDTYNLPVKLMDYTIGLGSNPLVLKRRKRTLWFSSSNMNTASFLAKWMDANQGVIPRDKFLLWKARLSAIYEREKAWYDLAGGKSFGVRLSAYRKRNAQVLTLMGIQDLAFLISRGWIGDCLMAAYNLINLIRKLAINHLREMIMWR